MNRWPKNSPKAKTQILVLGWRLFGYHRAELEAIWECQIDQTGLVMNRIIPTLIALSISTIPALAGLHEWTVVSQKDPFTGGKLVQVDYTYKYGTGQIKITCEKGQFGFLLSMLNGESIGSPMVKGPTLALAIDGEVLFSGAPVNKHEYRITGLPTFNLDKENSRKLSAGIRDANSQIAFKNEGNLAVLLLKTKGAAKAGRELLACLLY